MVIYEWKDMRYLGMTTDPDDESMPVRITLPLIPDMLQTDASCRELMSVPQARFLQGSAPRMTLGVSSLICQKVATSTKQVFGPVEWLCPLRRLSVPVRAAASGTTRMGTQRHPLQDTNLRGENALDRLQEYTILARRRFSNTRNPYNTLYGRVAITVSVRASTAPSTVPSNV